MPTIITHGITALLISKLLIRQKKPLTFWVAVALCAMIPDLDVIGFAFGIEYSDLWGHRGMTHSLFFAFVMAFIIGHTVMRKKHQSFFSKSSLNWTLFFFVIIGSHGLFDMLTNGGLGIAIFSPFDTTRYFFPTTPVEVSPIGIKNFFSARGMEVLLSETTIISLPMIVLTVTLGFLIDRINKKKQN